MTKQKNYSIRQTERLHALTGKWLKDDAVYLHRDLGEHFVLQLSKAAAAKTSRKKVTKADLIDSLSPTLIYSLYNYSQQHNVVKRQYPKRIRKKPSKEAPVFFATARREY